MDRDDIIAPDPRTAPPPEIEFEPLDAVDQAFADHYLERLEPKTAERAGMALSAIYYLLLGNS